MEGSLSTTTPDTPSPVDTTPTLSLATLPPELLLPIFQHLARHSLSSLLPIITLNTYIASVAIPILYSGTVRIGHNNNKRCLRLLAGTFLNFGAPYSRFHGTYPRLIRDLEVKLDNNEGDEEALDDLRRFLARCTRLKRLVLARTRDGRPQLLQGTVRKNSCCLVDEVLKVLCDNCVELNELELQDMGRLVLDSLPRSLETLRTSGCRLALPNNNTLSSSSQPSFPALKSLILGETSLFTDGDTQSESDEIARQLPTRFPNLRLLKLAIPSCQFPPPLEEILPKFGELVDLTITNAWNVHPRFLARLPPKLENMHLHSTPLSLPWFTHLRTLRTVELDNCLFDARELLSLSTRLIPGNLEKLKVILHDAPLRTRTRRLFQGLVDGGGLGFELDVEYTEIGR